MPQAPARPQRRHRPPLPGSSRLTVLRPEAILWDVAVEAFLAECTRLNLSPKTVTLYRHQLAGSRITTFLDDHGIRSVGEFDGAALAAFEAELGGCGLSATTVRIYHGTLRSLLAFSAGRGWNRHRETVTAVKPPRRPEPLRTGYSTAEMAAIYAATARTNAPARDRMLIEFMARTGARREEVCNVFLTDIEEIPGHGAIVRITPSQGRRTKNMKGRIVPLDTPGDQFSMRLFRYIRRDRPTDTRQPYLFLSTRRTTRDDRGRLDYAPLTGSGVLQICEQVGALCRPDPIHVHPHRFRHHFALQALRAGLDGFALQKALGHSTMDMVRKYLNSSENDLLEAWKARRD